MPKIIVFMVSSIAILCLTACMAPDKFEAECELKRNGQFIVTFNGTVTNLTARKAILKADKEGQLSATGIKKEADELIQKLKNDSRVKKFNDKGDDTYEILYEDAGNIKEQGKVFFLTQDIPYRAFLAYDEQSETVSFVIEPPSQDYLNQLEALNIAPEGKIVFKTDATLVLPRGDTNYVKNSFHFYKHTITVDINSLKEGVKVVWSLQK